MDSTEVIELVPSPDDTGALDTMGAHWTWRLVSRPDGAVLDFGPPPLDTEAEAEAHARAKYPDHEVDTDGS